MGSRGTAGSPRPYQSDSRRKPIRAKRGCRGSLARRTAACRRLRCSPRGRSAPARFGRAQRRRPPAAQRHSSRVSLSPRVRSTHRLQSQSVRAQKRVGRELAEQLESPSRPLSRRLRGSCSPLRACPRASRRNARRRALTSSEIDGNLAKLARSERLRVSPLATLAVCRYERSAGA